MKNILITGIRGFIGFNAIQLWKKIRPQYNYIGIDNMTYADMFMIQEKNQWLEDNNVDVFKIDISDDTQILRLENIIKEHKIDTIVNFAAESHVDNSIKNPNIFFETNIIGIANLLNIAKKLNLRFHQVGTDEVYGETTPADWYLQHEGDIDTFSIQIKAEEKTLVPSSPYSSSKASADMIALAYHRTFGLNSTVSRCTNNFGPWQHTEKLIGTTISKALKDEKIPVYGKGNQKRHWIYVDEHNRCIMDILEKGISGKIYNIGPNFNNWIANIDLIKFILQQLGKSESLIEHVTDRLGHDTSYYLVGTEFCKSKKLWQDDMKSTIEWYQKMCQ